MTIRNKTQANIPPDIFNRLMGVSCDDILIGGQALAVWVDIYGIGLPENIATVSRDVDFLTTSPTARSSLYRYAEILDGKTHIFKSELMTSLVGQAYKELPNDEILNVDVLWSIIGIDAASVRANAVHAARGETSFLVMHPMDVLRSRLINLHKLPEKCDEKGVMQLRLSIDVMRAHMQRQSVLFLKKGVTTERNPLQHLVSAIEKLAIDDAGRKIAKRFCVHVADAIDPSLIPAGLFWTKKWGTLKKLMSTEYASQFSVLEHERQNSKKPKTRHVLGCP